MASAKRKLVLTQIYQDFIENGKPYKVKKLINITDYNIGETLSKKQIDNLISTGIDVEISKI